MDITIDQQVAVVGGALIVACLLLVVWIVRHLTSFAKALQRHAEVNAALNDELLETVKERRVERQQCMQQMEVMRAQLKHEQRVLENELKTIRAKAEQSDALQKELETVKVKLEQALKELARQREANERLQERVGQLEREGREKDTKIATLRMELQDSETGRKALITQINTLSSQLNGKADKPTTDDLKESAEKVRRELGIEGTDETKPQES